MSTPDRGMRVFEVPCTIEIEHSADSLHAHVELEGVDVGPGDQVIVHGAPIHVPFGERRVVTGRATVTRATVFGRLRAHIEGYLEITELFEVSFSQGRVS